MKVLKGIISAFFLILSALVVSIYYFLLDLSVGTFESIKKSFKKTN